jgi:hypothetical protein
VVEVVETQKVEKYMYSNYLRKAQEYLEGMKDELVNRRWNLAVLLASIARFPHVMR